MRSASDVASSEAVRWANRQLGISVSLNQPGTGDQRGYQS